MIKLYTDGSSRKDGAGYAVVIIKDNKIISTITKQFEKGTNNEMELKAIVPGKEPDKEAFSSDRLIFEADLRDQLGDLEAFNCFEVQIYWNSNLGANNISDETCGKILDLTISTDKSYAH